MSPADHGGGPSAQTRRVLVRTLTAPQGFPWEQSKAAQLDARLNSPLPITDLAFQLKRLDPWSPGAPARFAVLYARRSDIGDGFEELHEIDGRTLKVRFETAEAQAKKRLQALLIFGACAILGLLPFLGVTAALSARDEADARLDRIEAEIAARNRSHAVLLRAIAEARALENAGLRPRTLDHVLTDLAWVVEAKRPEARLLSWYWERGLMAVEFRGSEAPFLRPDRLVKRSEGEVARGVYLYGIGPSGSLHPTPPPALSSPPGPARPAR